MTEKRLNHLILLHSYKQRTDEVNITEVAEDFVERTERWSEFFVFFFNVKLSYIKIKHILSKGAQPLPQQSLGGGEAKAH